MFTSYFGESLSQISLVFCAHDILLVTIITCLSAILLGLSCSVSSVHGNWARLAKPLFIKEKGRASQQSSSYPGVGSGPCSHARSPKPEGDVLHPLAPQSYLWDDLWLEQDGAAHFVIVSSSLSDKLTRYEKEQVAEADRAAVREVCVFYMLGSA